MMKKSLLTLFIVLLASGTCLAFNPLDVFTEENDKQLHALTSYVITDIAQDNLALEWWQGYLLIEGIGYLKEHADCSAGGKWDTGDQDANRMGWLLYNVINYRLEW